MSEFLENCTEKEAILYKEYFNEFDSDEKQPYHILIYDANHSDDIYEYQYLIYIPGAGEMQDLSYHTVGRGFLQTRKYMTFNITCTPAENDQTLFLYHYRGSEELPYQYLITYNGEEHEIRPDGHIVTPFFSIESKE